MTTKNSVAVVESDAVVVSMTRVSLALAEAVTISQTKKILDVAAAAEVYARRQHLSKEAERMAAAVKVEALRKLGEMLKAAPKAKGELLRGTKSAPRETQPETLEELGLTKKESALAQKIAELSEDAFQEVREGHLSVAKALAAVDSAKRAPTGASTATETAASSTPEQRAPGPATKTKPMTPAEQEREQAQEDAYGDTDPVAMLESMHKQIEELTALVVVAEANDAKAEALKWRRAYDAAVRAQSEAMTRAKEATDREAWTMRQLRRCGKAVNQDDPTKIAAAVEAALRSNVAA